jgi:malate dehydrogenase (oxaloacetate-decarboxylating)(NADP+)
VARAAIESGVATRPIADWDAYIQQLSNFVYQTGLLMKPVFATAKLQPRRIAYAEGEDERVLRAVQIVVDEGLARPILVGRRDVILARIERFGLRLEEGDDFELVNIESDPRYKELWSTYYALTQRKGMSLDYAKVEARRRTTLISALLLRLGHTDGVLCGTYGPHRAHLRFVRDVLGMKPGVRSFYTMNLLSLPGRTVGLCDTYVNYDPSVEQVVEMTELAAEELMRFGMVPKIALLSHSSFGTDETPTAAKMRQALAILHERRPDLEAEGEMHGDAALDGELRRQIFPSSRLDGDANLLVFPTLDAANIAFNLLKTSSGEGLTVGPILMGATKPVHILTQTATVRRIVNMTALTVVEAGQEQRAPQPGGGHAPGDRA